MHVHGIDIGPATPLYLVSIQSAPCAATRAEGRPGRRIAATPRVRGCGRHAFSSTATQLNQLELVAAGIAGAQPGAVCPPCGVPRQVSPVAGRRGASAAELGSRL